MGFGSEPETQTVTQTSGISPEFQPYLRKALGAAQTEFLDTPQQEKIAGFTPEEQQSFAGQRQLLSQPFMIDPAVMQTLQSTAAGEGFTQPQFQQQFQAAARGIIPQMQSRAALTGRTGSGLAQAAETEALANAYAWIAGQERQNQLQAAQLLPQLQQQQYGTQLGQQQQLGQVGAQQRAMEQAMLEAQGRGIQQFTGVFGGLPIPQTSQQSQPIYQNQAATGLGAGLAGAQLGSGFGPMGALVGGGLGLLGGLF